jgi:hypothetical protein
VEQTLARRTFDVIDIVEILVHWYAGRSQHELSASLSVDRKTVRKYLAPAVAAGLEAGGPPMARPTGASTWWSGSRSCPMLGCGRGPGGRSCHRDYISARLKVGVTVATIHQRLVDEHGLTASVASVRR